MHAWYFIGRHAARRPPDGKQLQLTTYARALLDNTPQALTNHDERIPVHDPEQCAASIHGAFITPESPLRCVVCSFTTNMDRRSMG